MLYLKKTSLKDVSMHFLSFALKGRDLNDLKVEECSLVIVEVNVYRRVDREESISGFVDDMLS